MKCMTCTATVNETARYCSVCGAAIPHSDKSATIHIKASAAGGAMAPPDNAATLFLAIRLPDMSEIIWPLSQAACTIGSGADADVHLPDQSFRHLRFQVLAKADGFIVRDLSGATSLIWRGAHVTTAPLSEREPIYVPNAAHHAITFSLRPTASGANLGPAAGNARSVRLHADQSAVTFGRDPSNDIVIDHPLVSRFHAEIEHLDSHVLLHDRGSANGTYVNGTHVQGLRELQVGDEIRIGPTAFRYTGVSLDTLDAQIGVRIDAIDLTKRVGRHGKKLLLDGVSMTIEPGEFVALLGGSGAGKSTLLHALAGVTPAQDGQVLYNGHDIYRAATGLGTRVAYVPQDDILHRELSVERALYYAAKLRLPQDTSDEERDQRITDVLGEVQMLPQRRQPIARLSGGQRKRVSIAVELLANPAVLFLDEPTSGLDSGLDKTIMTLLRQLCDQGRTIVLVTHTTENVALCDLVAFLAFGRLVYYGPPAQAPSHFTVSSYSDIYTQVGQSAQAGTEEIRLRGSLLYRTYVLARQATLKIPAEPPLDATPTSDPPQTPQRQRAAAIHQWRILTARYAELVRLDRVNLALLLAQTPIVAFVLTLVASVEVYTSNKVNNTQAVLLMLVIATLWFSLTNAAREIVKERPVYLRERLINLQLFPYLLSKVVVLSVLSVLQVLALFWILRLKTPHLPAQGVFLPAPLEMLITLSLCACACLLLGLFISCVARSTDRAMTVVPIFLIPQVVFSGAVFNLTGWSSVLSYLTISHWGLAALGSTVRLNDAAAQLYAGPGLVKYLHDPRIADMTGGWPREMYASPDMPHLLGYWGALVIFSLVFLLATLVMLRRGDIGAVAHTSERLSKRTWSFLLLPPVVFCGGLALLSARSGNDAAPPTPTTTTVPSLVTSGSAAMLGMLPGNTPLTLSLQLPYQNQAGLDAFIANKADHGSYLTQGNFIQQYSPTSEQVASVKQWAVSQNLQTDMVSADRTLITVHSSAAAIAQALHISLASYRAPDGAIFYANTSDPILPAGLPIASITGLTNEARFFALKQPARATQRAATTMHAGGYIPSDLRAAYGVTGHNVDGSEQAIGFTLWGAALPNSDLAAFAARTGDRQMTGHVATQTTGAGADQIEWVFSNGVERHTDVLVETAMDVEYGHGMAPHSHLIYYLGNEQNGQPTEPGLLNALSLAANNPQLHIVSNSWGGSEPLSRNDSFVKATTAIFQHAVAVGTTFYFSSGDNGTDSGGTGKASYPSDSPYVVSVGGTRLTTTPSGEYSAEQVWNSSSIFSPSAGTGAGCSTIFTRPTWQNGVQAGDCTYRAEPDISADADPNTGAYVYSGGQASKMGGTSLAAPLIAGMAADADRYAAQSHQARTGWLAPKLYRLGATTNAGTDYHDITTGVTSGSIRYQARPQWDQATGWGSIAWWDWARAITART